MTLTYRLVGIVTAVGVAILLFHLPLYFFVNPHKVRWLWRIDEWAGLAWLFIVTLLPLLVLAVVEQRYQRLRDVK